jgi:hypothetical protein
MGVITHYVVAKLYEVITCLLEKTARSSVTITSSFYSYLDGVIIDIWKPLMRILHLGGSGDAFAQSKILFSGLYSTLHLLGCVVLIFYLFLIL